MNFIRLLPYEILSFIFTLTQPSFREKYHRFVSSRSDDKKLYNTKACLALVDKYFYHVYEHYAKKEWFRYICTGDFPKFSNQDIYKLPCLQEISLTKSTKITITGLRNISNLKSLYLRGSNRISTAQLTSLTSIQRLGLYDNRSISHSTCLNALPNLEKVGLYNTFIPYIPEQVTDLYLASGSAIPINFQNLTNLTKLSLRDHPISTRRLDELPKLTSLVKLKLFSVGKFFTNDLLKQLTTLKKLEIWNSSHITLEGYSSLVNLTKLRIR